jgi:hypothetical protein
MQSLYEQYREKYPNAKIKITYNDQGQEELLIINNLPISKKEQKREKQRAKQLENKQIKQLSNINLPNQLAFKHVSKNQIIKEEKLKMFMDLNFLKYVKGGRKHYTYGLDNIPRSRWDKQKTEFECQRDKKPQSFEAWLNNAKLITMTPNGHRILEYPSVIKESPIYGMKHIPFKEAEKITKAKLPKKT